jgi:hypothetical protein
MLLSVDGHLLPYLERPLVHLLGPTFLPKIVKDHILFYGAAFNFVGTSLKRHPLPRVHLIKGRYLREQVLYKVTVPFFERF